MVPAFQKYWLHGDPEAKAEKSEFCKLLMLKLLILKNKTSEQRKTSNGKSSARTFLGYKINVNVTHVTVFLILGGKSEIKTCLWVPTKGQEMAAGGKGSEQERKGGKEREKQTEKGN